MQLRNQVEEKPTRTVGFAVLSNGNIMKGLEDKLQIIDSATSTIKNFPIRKLDKDYVPFHNFLIAELSNQSIVFSFGTDTQSIIGAIDLVNGVFYYEFHHEKIHHLLAISDDTVVVTAGWNFRNSIYKNYKFIRENSPRFDARRTFPIFLPKEDKITVIELKGNLLSVLNLDETLNEKIESTSTFHLNRILMRASIALPDDKIAFLNLKLGNCHCYDYLCIYDRNTAQFTETILNGNSSINDARYHQLFLINNTYLMVGGVLNSKDDSSNICIKLYDISNNKMVIIKEAIIEHCNMLDVLPDDRLITCNSFGKIMVHDVLPNSEKLREKTEYVLKDLPINVIQIITDYAGLFRKKSQKSQEQDVFEEARIADPKRCIIL